jgi:hypothetical protein
MGLEKLSELFEKVVPVRGTAWATEPTPNEIGGANHGDI